MSDLVSAPVSATESIARAVLLRAPRWVADRLYNHLWVFGDPDAGTPGRHIICDGTTEHPVVIANARGCRLTIELPHMIGGDDIEMVVDALAAFGALDPPDDAPDRGSVRPVIRSGKTAGWYRNG